MLRKLQSPIAFLLFCQVAELHHGIVSNLLLLVPFLAKDRESIQKGSIFRRFYKVFDESSGLIKNVCFTTFLSMLPICCTLSPKAKRITRDISTSSAPIHSFNHIWWINHMMVDCRRGSGQSSSAQGGISV